MKEIYDEILELLQDSVKESEKNIKEFREAFILFYILVPLTSIVTFFYILKYGEPIIAVIWLITTLIASLVLVLKYGIKYYALWRAEVVKKKEHDLNLKRYLETGIVYDQENEGNNNKWQTHKRKPGWIGRSV